MRHNHTIYAPKHKGLAAELTDFGEFRQHLVAMGETSNQGLPDFRNAIIGIVRSALDDERAASKLRGQLDELEASLRHVENRAEGKRRAALAVMTQSGLESLEAPGLRINVRQAPAALVIRDESLVPDTFRILRPAGLDYSGIRDVIAGGGEVPGVMLGVPDRYLSVRTEQGCTSDPRLCPP